MLIVDWGSFGIPVGIVKWSKSQSSRRHPEASTEYIHGGYEEDRNGRDIIHDVYFPVSPGIIDVNVTDCDEKSTTRT